MLCDAPILVKQGKTGRECGGFKWAGEQNIAIAQGRPAECFYWSFPPSPDIGSVHLLRRNFYGELFRRRLLRRSGEKCSIHQGGTPDFRKTEPQSHFYLLSKALPKAVFCRKLGLERICPFRRLYTTATVNRRIPGFPCLQGHFLFTTEYFLPCRTFSAVKDCFPPMVSGGRSICRSALPEPIGLFDFRKRSGDFFFRQITAGVGTVPVPVGKGGSRAESAAAQGKVDATATTAFYFFLPFQRSSDPRNSGSISAAAPALASHKSENRLFFTLPSVTDCQN